MRPQWRLSRGPFLRAGCFGIQAIAALGSLIPQYVKDNAPLLWLHSNDPYRPSDIATHLSHVDPYYANFTHLDSPPLDLTNLSTLPFHGQKIYLSSPDISHPTLPWLLGTLPNTTGALLDATACAVVLVNNSVHDLDAFYFYFYSYNQGADILQVVPPMRSFIPNGKPGDHFGNHIGDWEYNMVRFRSGKPTGIYFSQHGGGQECKWNDKHCFSRNESRPVVYSAKGSHANYASSGAHVHDEALIDLCDEGYIWDPLLPAYFFKYDPKTQVVEAITENTPTDWLHFSGWWGNKQLEDLDPRQKFVPHFGLAKYGDGPTGPLFKQIVRKGLMPDYVAPTPWLKTFVRAYLGLYGCCIQGYRWVGTLVVSVLILVGVLWLLVRMVVKVWRVAVTTVRRRKQKEQEQDEPEIMLGLLDPEGELRGEDPV